MSARIQGIDIAIVWSPQSYRGDFSLTAAGDLVTGNPLESAVLVSLFTDARRTPDYRPPSGDTDRRGWWADTFTGFKIGSNLWQLQRRKIVDRPALLLEAQGYVQTALQWLIADGIAASVNVSCSFLQPSIMGIGVVIVEPDGSVTNFAYAWAWQGLG